MLALIKYAAASYQVLALPPWFSCSRPLYIPISQDSILAPQQMDVLHTGPVDPCGCLSAYDYALRSRINCPRSPSLSSYFHYHQPNLHSFPSSKYQAEMSSNNQNLSASKEYGSVNGICTQLGYPESDSMVSGTFSNLTIAFRKVFMGDRLALFPTTYKEETAQRCAADFLKKECRMFQTTPWRYPQDEDK